MKSTKMNFFAGLIMTMLFAPPGINWGVDAVVKAQKALSAGSGRATAVQQPLYKEYRGIRLGMSAEEVRAKLGEPASKADDQDYYVLSENEAAQIVYDSEHKTKAISVDYMGGVGAPDPKAVVGGDLEVLPKGLFKLVRHENLGYWVSYYRTTGSVVVVTVTIQKT